MITLDEKSNGSAVDIKVGETFEVSLPENPTTGYRWQQKSGPAFVSTRFIPDPIAKPESIGAGGTRIWIFSASSVGSSQIDFDLVRASPPPMEKFSLTVNVKQ